MKTKIRRIKNHVLRHRFAYGVGTGLAIGVYIQVKSAEQWNAFLTEQDLWNEFYDYSE